MVLDNLETSYSGQYLLEDSSDQVLPRQESDDTLAPSAKNNPRQLLDKGKQNAAVHAFFNSYSYHCFSLESLSAGATSSTAGTNSGCSNTPSISQRQIVTSVPSTTAVMSTDRKRNEVTAFTSMVMHMPESHSGSVSAKKKAKCSTATIDPNLNRMTPYLPKETKMVTETTRPLEEECSYFLSSNQLRLQLRLQPLATSSSINWNTVEQLTSASDVSGAPSLSTEHTLFNNASTSQAIPIGIQGTKSQIFDQNALYPDSSLSDLERNLKISEGRNILFNHDISTFSMDHMNQVNQLSHGSTSNLFSPFQFNELVSLTNGKVNSSHDTASFDQQSLERLSLNYDNVVATQSDQQLELTTIHPLLQNLPSGVDLLPYDNSQKPPGIWPSMSKNFAVQFSYEEPHQKGNLTTPSLSSIEIYTGLTSPISEEYYIPEDVIYDDANWRSDPTLEQQPPKFPGDLYTPYWVKIKDGKRWGLCRSCFEENVILWLKIKCSSYRYHMNTHHGICSNGKSFAEPIDKRIMPDGTVEFYCHECNRYKHIQRHPQDEIFKWWRHAAECHTSSRKANMQNKLKRLCKNS